MDYVEPSRDYAKVKHVHRQVRDRINSNLDDFYRISKRVCELLKFARPVTGLVPHPYRKKADDPINYFSRYRTANFANTRISYACFVVDRMVECPALRTDMSNLTWYANHHLCSIYHDLYSVKVTRKAYVLALVYNLSSTDDVAEHILSFLYSEYPIVLGR